MVERDESARGRYRQNTVDSGQVALQRGKGTGLWMEGDGADLGMQMD